MPKPVSSQQNKYACIHLGYKLILDNFAQTIKQHFSFVHIID